MRKVVYDNIIELVDYGYSTNKTVKEDTTKYALCGPRKKEILSLYRNDRKIELFINNKLFASARYPELFNKKDTLQFKQLYNIECALKGQPLYFSFDEDKSIKYLRGTTPAQVETLRLAWWKAFPGKTK